MATHGVGVLATPLTVVTKYLMKQLQEEGRVGLNSWLEGTVHHGGKGWWQKCALSHGISNQERVAKTGLQLVLSFSFSLAQSMLPKVMDGLPTSVTPPETPLRHAKVLASLLMLQKKKKSPWPETTYRRQLGKSPS